MVTECQPWLRDVGHGYLMATITGYQSRIFVTGLWRILYKKIVLKTVNLPDYLRGDDGECEDHEASLRQVKVRPHVKLHLLLYSYYFSLIDTKKRTF